MQQVEISITIPGPLITFKSASWGAGQMELYLESQEAIRAAVQKSQYCGILRELLTNRTKLRIEVEFHLKPLRTSNADLDYLLSDLFNPLVEGACGPQPAQKPIPQVKDALFWECHAVKNSVPETEEKPLLRFNLLDS